MGALVGIMQGICALCGNQKEIVKSHLLAAGFYRLLQDKDTENGTVIEPAHFNENVGYLLSKQIKRPLLCMECELRFKQREDRVIEDCFHANNGSFPLKERLANEIPVFTNADGIFYAGERLKGIDAGEYKYFALSVFWRGSAFDWSDQRMKDYKNALGIKYEEMFKQYLLGHAQYPSQAHLLVCVSNNIKVGLMSLPSVAQDRRYYYHNFTVPGIKVYMMLGERIHPKNEKIFKSNNSKILFVACPVESMRFYQNINKRMPTVVPKGKLAKLLKRPQD